MDGATNNFMPLSPLKRMKSIVQDENLEAGEGSWRCCTIRNGRLVPQLAKQGEAVCAFAFRFHLQETVNKSRRS